MLFDVLGLVRDHANEGVQLDDDHTQVDHIHGVSKKSSQGWNKVCEEVDLIIHKSI